MDEYFGSTYGFTQEVTTESGPVYLYEEGQILVQIRKWLICPIGCVGNVLCIIILLRAPMNRMLMTPYLIVIAINDFLYLFSDTVNEIVFRSGWTSEWYCKLARYIANTSGSLSDMLVAVVAIHRAIAVSVPLKAERYCGPSSPKKIIAVVSLVVMLLFLEVFWIAQTDPILGFCKDNPKYPELVQMEAGLIMGKTLLAVITIAASSGVILHNLRQHTKAMIPHCAEDRINTSRKTKDEQIGTMLLSISILFLVTNVPLAIFFIVRTIIEIEVWLNEFIYVITLTMKNLNHALNFWFYCFSAQMFRNELQRLFNPLCKNCGACKNEAYRPNVSSVMGNSEGRPEAYRHEPLKSSMSHSNLDDTKIEYIGRL